MTPLEFLTNFHQVLQPVLTAWFANEPDYAAEVAPTALGKRQNKLEAELDKVATEFCLAHHYSLETEGKAPVLVLGAEFKIYLDPVDGTSGLARTVGTDFHSSDSALMAVIMPVKEGLKFGDAAGSLIINLRSGQAFLAAGEQVLKSDWGKSWQPYSRQPQYSRHTPLLGSDFNRRINRVALGLLIPQEVGWSDIHSSGLNMLQAVIGKVDCVINNPCPQISTEGQRGHELAAMMPFVKILGAVSLDLRTGESLAATPFTFDGMTPSLVAVDRATADYYLNLIRAQASQTITIGGETISLEEGIKRLLMAVPTIPWTLRPESTI
jgi:hypothetical protein